MTLYKAKVERDTPPDQASTIPDQVNTFATNDWNQRRGGVAGKFQTQADSTAHVYHNKINVDAQLNAVQNRDKYTELTIDGTAEKQNNAVMANPGQLPSATSAIGALVDETSVNDFEKRRLKLKYGNQLYDAVNKGYVDRLQKEPFNNALMQEAEDFRKNGTGQIAKQLGVQDLPATAPGPVNQKRVSEINAKPQIANVIEDVAKEKGINADALKVRASIESSGNPGTVTGENVGLFQIDRKEFAKYGPPDGNIFNPRDNTIAAVNKMIDQEGKFSKTMGRPPTPTESYMMHQQGDSGAAAHFANPSGIAWQNVRRFYPSEDVAKQAIWGNLSKEEKKQFGSVDKVTSSDFIASWDRQVTGGDGPGSAAVKGVDANFFTSRVVKGGQINMANVNPTFAARLQRGIAAAEAATGTKIEINEMDRTVATQAKYRAAYESGEGGLAARPGQSRHNFETHPGGAEAADLTASPAREWLRAHAGEFGLDHLGSKDLPHFQMAGGGGPMRPVEAPTYQAPVAARGGPAPAQSRPMVIQNTPGNWTVIPTVSSDGFKVLSDSQAVTQFQQTGQHVGVFDNSSAANDYADRLSRVEQRADVPRAATIDQTSPLLGQTPKEMIARQDHWDAQYRALDAQRKQIQEQAQKRGNADLGQEESAVKIHGNAGINPMWTPQAMAMVYGAHDAEVKLDQREANLKFHGATSGWSAASDPAQMAADLESLNPARVNPQSAAFTQYGKNYDEARALMTKTIEARDKLVKARGDAEMKNLIDAARSAKVTDDMITSARPWLNHSELTAAYNLKDNPPVVRNDAATIDVHNAIRTMPPPEFQKYMMGWKAKNAFSNDDFKSYIERNETYWAQGVQPPIIDAHKWLEAKMTPGMSGIEGSIMRGSMADAVNELKDWENNPLNKEQLKDRAVVMQKTRDIYSRYQMEGLKQIRFGLAPSVYFPPGTHPENVDAAVIADAKAKLAVDMQKTNAQGQRLMSEAEMQTRWQNLKAWQDSMTDEQRAVKPPPAPANPTAPKKMSAQIAPPPQGIPPNGMRQKNPDQIEQPAPSGEGYDRNAIRPEDVMNTRTATDLQENI